jgi:hypothetical protein
MLMYRWTFRSKSKARPIARRIASNLSHARTSMCVRVPAAGYRKTSACVFAPHRTWLPMTLLPWKRR